MKIFKDKEQLYTDLSVVGLYFVALAVVHLLDIPIEYIILYIALTLHMKLNKVWQAIRSIYTDYYEGDNTPNKN